MNKWNVILCHLAFVAFLAFDTQALMEDEDLDQLNRECWGYVDLVKRRVSVAVQSMNGELTGQPEPINAIGACLKAASALSYVQDWPEMYKKEEGLEDCLRNITSVDRFFRDVCHIFCAPEYEDMMTGSFESLGVDICQRSHH